MGAKEDSRHGTNDDGGRETEGHVTEEKGAQGGRGRQGEGLSQVSAHEHVGRDGGVEKCQQDQNE